MEQVKICGKIVETDNVQFCALASLHIEYTVWKITFDYILKYIDNSKFIRHAPLHIIHILLTMLSDYPLQQYLYKIPKHRIARKPI